MNEAENEGMALYLIGDVQGCDDALGRLLAHIDFSPSRDSLVLLGDLVNRGPSSAEVLRRVQRLGASARSLLGNHDLHLLGVAHGARKSGRKDTLDAVLEAHDREALLEWLRHQHLALHEVVGGGDLLMVHAGVLPQWGVARTMALAAEVEGVLRGPDLGDFVRGMYGNEPALWNDSLTGAARLRAIVNGLTRLRFCTAQGLMDFDAKEGADAAPEGFMPWFDVPHLAGDRGLRALVDAGLAVAPRPDLHRHGLRLGWMPERRAHRRDTRGA
jgi:bis(5'-nucleosyl)-tetraphosphatase (symmetrical)